MMSKELYFDEICISKNIGMKPKFNVLNYCKNVFFFFFNAATTISLDAMWIELINLFFIYS